MKSFIRQPQYLRFFSSLREIPEFKLVKFNPKSKGDYELFRTLIINNLEFSALQFLIPNINDDLPDLTNKAAVRKYFDHFGKEKYLRDAYSFLTQNHEKGNLGYNKVMQGDKFIGNAGWIMHQVDNNGVIHKIERGIHLNQELCSPNAEVPNNSFKPRIGATVIRQVVQVFEDNLDHLNPDGQLVSSILLTNNRSKAFTQKYRLNVGEPTYQENGANKWVQRIGDFTNRLPEIKGLLDETIKNKGR